MFMCRTKASFNPFQDQININLGSCVLSPVKKHEKPKGKINVSWNGLTSITITESTHHKCVILIGAFTYMSLSSVNYA